MYQNYLKDEEFLIKLHENRYRETYIKIINLNWEEDPITQIEGKITGGTLNLDGTSAVRRTCNLTMVTSDDNVNDYSWGINTKIKIEIGLKNTVGYSYPDIIWFPQGTFVLTTFNMSLSNNNYNISLSAKDKMCLLNGDIGGSLESSIDFGVEKDVDLESNTITYTHIPIKTIIRNAVNVYGKEPLHNIVINDIDAFGYELLDYKGAVDSPLYLLRNANNGIYVNMTMKGDFPVYPWNPTEKIWETTSVKISDINFLKRIDDLIDADDTSTEATLIKLKLEDDATQYYVCQITENETVGYRLTDLTYAGDLICNPGDSLTSILDKIKNMLGNFEYFYDLDGRFVFQQKKNNIYSNWNPLVETNEGIYVDTYNSPIAYSFNNSELLISFQNTPNLTNLKNDFSIWGNRKSITGEDLPIHFRYALDKKPIEYVSIEMTADEANQLKKEYGFDNLKAQPRRIFSTEDRNPEIIGSEFTRLDYREIIYQMALDYYAYNKLDDFVQRVAAANPIHYPTGYTGYEIYYTDIQGFWRQLYNFDFKTIDFSESEPNKNIKYFKLSENGAYEELSFESLLEDDIIRIKDWDINIDYYTAEGDTYVPVHVNIDQPEDSLGFDPELDYYIKENDILIPFNIYYFNEEKNFNIYSQSDLGYESFYDNTKRHYWNIEVEENPSVLNFWFDLLGEGTSLDPYLVSVIGDRKKVVSDSDIKGIYFKETPNVLFITNEESVELTDPTLITTGYTFIQVNETLTNFFNISSQGKSAHNVLEELLEENTYCSEVVNITSVPIYYLDINTRINIQDLKHSINGEYILTKITLPLTYNGNMSMSATKAADTIY